MSLSQIDPADMSRQQLLDYCYSLEARLESDNEMQSNAGRGKLQAFFKLTAKEAQVLASLADGRLYTKGRLLLELYSDRGDDTPEPKIIDVFICKLRSKVARYGVDIQTVWGTGYQLANPKILEAVAEGGELELVEDPPSAPKRGTGTYPNRTGSMRRQAVAQLAELIGSADRLIVSPTAFAKAIEATIPGATLLRQLERADRIKVHSKQKGGNWTVSLTQRGREMLA